MWANKMYHTLVKYGVICAIAFSFSLSAQSHSHDTTSSVGEHEFVYAELLAQGQSTVTPISGLPLFFSQINIKRHIKIEERKAAFKIKHSGFYYITSKLQFDASNTGTIKAAIAINGQIYQNFSYSLVIFDVPASLTLNIAEGLYLDKGDKISIVITEIPTDTTIDTPTLNIIRTKDLHPGGTFGGFG